MRGGKKSTAWVIRFGLLAALSILVPACADHGSSGGGGIVSPGSGGVSGTPGATTSAWQNPLPAGHRINDLAAYDPNGTVDDDEVIWAVGDLGTIRYSDDGGLSWTDQDSGTTENLHGIALLVPTAGTEDLVAVGENGTILLTIDGGDNWITPTTIPTAVEALDFYGVSFPSASVGYLVGESDAANSDAQTILKTTDGGDTWVAQTVGNANFEGQRLLDVYFSSTTLGWAVGEYTFDGNGKVLVTTDGGTNWSMAPLANWGYSPWGLRGVDGFEPDLVPTDNANEVVVFVGPTGNIFRTPDGGATYPFVGNIYSPSTNDYAAFQAVDMINATTGYAVAESGVVFKTINGGANWVEQVSGVDTNLFAVAAIDPDLGWAAGDGMLTIGTRDAGTTWDDLLNSEAVTRTGLASVYFADANNGWAVGDGGTIVGTANGGTLWELQTSNTTRSLNAVQFADANNGWAVGDNGTIVATVDGGTTWEVQTSGVNRRMNGVDFTNSTTGWAVGNNGTILHTSNGTDWVIQTSAATSKHLNAVDFVGNFGWAVGSTGTIVHTADGGATWAEQDSGVNFALNGVSFTGSLLGWAVGQNGTILVTLDGGTTWTEQTSGVNTHLQSVRFTDDFHGTAVGDGGLILITLDGGITWDPMTLATNNDLVGIDMISNTTGWAVGANGTILKLQ